MEEMLSKVGNISNQISTVVGKHSKKLFDKNLVFQNVEVRVDIMEVGSNSSVPRAEIESAEHHSLVQSLSSMFPETPIDYIWDQAQDLVGKHAAIERFTKQLLENHLPPANWTLELTLECECCYSNTPETGLVSCPAGHTFCQDCVQSATSVAMGEGKTIIRCMVDCIEEINWQQLGRALESNVLFNLEQKRQAEEVITAGLDNLVACPFCPYQTVMEDPNDKVLICKNPDCGEDSCRLCKEPSHIPKRCDELPQVEEARKKIEEQLSLAMLRECWQCKKMFFKEEGCNRMACTCGAQMCYLCRAQVTSYDHFYGKGGNPGSERKCPLWSDNKALHKQEISAAAAKAKEELALSNTLSRVLRIDVEEGMVEVGGEETNIFLQGDLKSNIIPGLEQEAFLPGDFFHFKLYEVVHQEIFLPVDFFKIWE